MSNADQSLEVANQDGLNSSVPRHFPLEALRLLFKGFAYLRTVISNSDKNHDTVVENERKRLGSTPPIIQ